MNKIYQKSLCGRKNAGFTRIELLVVVLIIGILSAVALPQYTKAVTKSKVATAVASLKTIQQAEDACMLAKGEPCRLDELDISVPTVPPLPRYEVGGFAIVRILYKGKYLVIPVVQWGFAEAMQGIIVIGNGPEGLFCAANYGNCPALGFSKEYNSYGGIVESVDGVFSNGLRFTYYQ